MRHTAPNWLTRHCPAAVTAVAAVAVVAAVAAVAAVPAIAGDSEYLQLDNKVAVVRVAVAGGGITEFRLKGHKLNPLNWDIEGLEPIEKDKPYLRGHFLCLDRWGAPSESESKRGVPFHGEAPRIHWQVAQPPASGQGGAAATMGCRLKLAGLGVRREITLLDESSVVLVTEHVTNERPLGRVYNMVQHPSIAPPFLDATTLVDSNATLGFLQEGPVPNSTSGAIRWPHSRIADKTVDLRHFKPADTEVTGHDVSSFIFDEKTRHGWVTAVHPGSRLLLGYVWRTSEYPWLNIWRYRREGKVMARGLEFGTTGLHQPYPELVRRGRIFGRPLLSFIDSGQSVSRSYVMFLVRVPGNYAGVARLEVTEEKLTLTERGDGVRRLSVALRLPWTK